MYMLDALGREKEIKIHCHHHEQNAGIAAEAYARISGEPSFCFATSGPGGLNCVEAIAECWVDSVPVIFFIGQNSKEQTTRCSGIPGLRQNGPSEIDLLPVVTPITKKTYFVDSPYSIDTVLAEAYGIAEDGRPGPVVIIVPMDVQKAEYNPEYFDVVTALKKAERPLIIVGQGYPRYNLINQLICFCKENNIPIVSTQAAKDLIPYDNPSFRGHIGIKGNRYANEILMQADLIMSLGASLHTFTTGYAKDQFAPNAEIIYVDIDPSQLSRCNLPNVKKFCARAEVFMLDAVISRVKNLKESYWCDKHEYEEEYLNETSRLNIYNAIKVINRMSNPTDIIVSDAGSSFYAVGQEWKLKEGQRFISSNGLGTMGWALPAAFGAWQYSGKKVLCFTGDGSFMTGLSELYHIASEQANVTIIVFNNGGYLSIRNTQDTFFNGLHVGTDKSNGVEIPSIMNLCNSVISYFYVESEKELERIIGFTQKLTTPCVIEIKTNIMQGMYPTVGNVVNPDKSISAGTLDRMEPKI
jgi:acetolactate synthase-1/2/3 large subunit